MLKARTAVAAAPDASTPAAAAPAAAPKAAAVAKTPTTRKKKQSQIAAAASYKDKPLTVDPDGKPILSHLFNSKNGAGSYAADGDTVISANELYRMVAAETKHIFGSQLRVNIVKDILNAFQLTVLKATADGKKVKTLVATFEGVDKAAREAHNPRDKTKKINVPAHRVLKVKPTAATKAFVKGLKN